MSACFHCQDAGTCACITCGKEALGGWQAGKCHACAGNALWNKPVDDFGHTLRDLMPDPRDHRLWRIDRQTTGGSHRVYIPLEAIKK